MALYDRRKRLATDAPEGYQRSRAADREIYGTRAIDASAPLSVRSGTGAGVGERPMRGGLTPETSWRGFFDRSKPVGATAMSAPVSVSAFPEMGMEKGMGLSDPSQAFRVAGAPPIGGPATGRSALTQAGMNVPMPTTPTAMQYYQAGMEGAKPFVPGAVRSGDSFKGIYGEASVRSETMREFFDRYLKRRG